MGGIAPALLLSQPVGPGSERAASCLPGCFCQLYCLWAVLPLLGGAKTETSFSSAPGWVTLPTIFLRPHLARGERIQRNLSSTVGPPPPETEQPSC